MNLIVPMFNLLFHQPSIQRSMPVFSHPLYAECLSEDVRDISSVNAFRDQTGMIRLFWVRITMNSGLPSKQFRIHKYVLCPRLPYSFAVSKCGLMTTGHGRACGTQAVGDVIDGEGPRCGHAGGYVRQTPPHNGFITLRYLPDCQQGIISTEVESKINYADMHRVN